MALPNFINLFLQKRKDAKQYKLSLEQYHEKVKEFISDGVLSDDKKDRLKTMQTELGLKQDDLIQLHKDGLSIFFKQICLDQRITEDEKKQLENAMTFFNLDMKDSALDQDAFNRYYLLSLIENGTLPILPKEQASTFNIIFKDGEGMHYAQAATLRKFKRITTAINYRGMSGSIKIMKGLRYRMGSINVGHETQDIFAVDDIGIFYLTNQRIGFLGSRKQFDLPYIKINSIELKPEGLYIFKSGKEQAYILTMFDYEVALAIVSFILNK
jgi:hypothetical protein